ncbi:MAG: ABC transporter ATP-binding protein [Solirubrobacteraceae bacterium]
MATLALEQVTKVFENGVVAVKSVDLSINDGEFVVLVGPSGCGKTTVLRMVAGLEDVTSGIIRLNGEPANDVSPGRRDVAMVFQNYALYPHLDVHHNIAFSLAVRKVPKAVRDEKVREAAKLLGLFEMLHAKPRQLSGGQRQRVAMGRALVREPAIFLMDEPLSNLDASLRVQMRTEVMHIQRRLGAATMYVTHDHTEAMTMGDRVAVMRAGVLQQFAPPQELYDRPANVFVASFIGSPAMNLFAASIAAAGDRLEVVLGSQRLPLAAAKHPELQSFTGRDVVAGIRPEDLAPAMKRPDAEGENDCQIVADVDLVEALGNEQLMHFAIDAENFRAGGVTKLAVDSGDAVASRFAGTPAGKGISRVDPRVRVASGERVTLGLDVGRLHFFDPLTGLTLPRETGARMEVPA